jgi:signal transduction histidine kinase
VVASVVPSTGEVQLAGRRNPPGPAVLWSVVALAGFACVGSVVLLTASEAATGEGWLEAGVTALLVDWLALSFVVAGVVAWSRRPNSRFGPLMVVAGGSFWIWVLQFSNAPTPYTAGIMVDYLVVALLVHVYLAYPTGRVTRQPERALVLTGYGIALGLQLLKVLLGAEPRALITLVGQTEVADRIERVQIWALVALCLAAAALLVIRRLQGQARPRPVTLMVDAFGLALVMMAVFFTAGLLDWPGFGFVQFATFAVGGLVPVAFLLGLLDTRLARASVGDLLVGLRTSAVPDLRDPLRVALRDPSLTVAYWLPEFGSWADRAGQQVPAPKAVHDRGVAMIERDGRPIAALQFDKHLEDEPELVAAVTAAAGIALENDRLQVELRARVQELRESRVRMLDAGQKERQRLERNLHDGAQQRLVALSLELGMLEADLRSDPAVSGRLRRARGEIAVSLEELRDVARGIYPAVLSAHGLAVALESLAARFPVPLELTVVTGGRLAPALEAATYYVVCESLANIGKHADATSARVNVNLVGDRLVVEIVDDGIGGADTAGGTGLRGLADRVEALGGHLRIWSPSGGGTRVLADLPIS